MTQMAHCGQGVVTGDCEGVALFTQSDVTRSKLLRPHQFSGSATYCRAAILYMYERKIVQTQFSWILQADLRQP